MINNNFPPNLLFDVVKMNIVNIMIVSTTKDVNHSIVVNRCMTPTSRRNVFTKIKSSANDGRRRRLGEFTQIKNIEIVEMNIFAVATSEGNDAIIVNGCCRMKSFWLKALLTLNMRINPLVSFKIKSPKIIQVRISFAADHNHVMFYYSSSVVRSRLWN